MIKSMESFFVGEENYEQHDENQEGLLESRQCK